MNFKSFMLELLEVFIKTKGVFSLDKFRWNLEC